MQHAQGKFEETPKTFSMDSAEWIRRTLLASRLELDIEKPANYEFYDKSPITNPKSKVNLAPREGTVHSMSTIQE